MNGEQQLDFLNPRPSQEFEAWRQTAGGRLVLCHAYRLAAGYGERWRRSGQRVSVRLVWELLRDRFKHVRTCAKRKGVALDKWGGYALNDHFHPYVARHIVEHRPEWQGMFETRKVGK